MPSEAISGFATQTDWSGGDCPYGPVSDWGNEFYADTDIEPYTNPSNLILGYLKHPIDGDFINAGSIHCADINGDGYMDVLGGAHYGDPITWWENLDGLGTSWTKHIIDGACTATYAVYSADINGDGYMDVLGADRREDITWWENIDGSGTTWMKHTVDADFNGAESVYSADINGDGYPDVLGAAWHEDAIAWWENIDGSGTTWMKHTVDADFNGAVSVYSADINGDGYPDILGAACSADDISWWENVDGSGTTWTKHTVDGDFNGAESVYSADINGDGYPDVLGAAFDDDEITWWENVNGSGTIWTEHIVDGNFNGAHSVFPADIDADGDQDLAGAAYNADEICWWENVDGLGTIWTKHTVVEEYFYATSVYSADIDGDYHMDILGVGNLIDDITWWDLTAFPPEGRLESSVLDVQDVSVDWDSINWNSTEPPGTCISFLVRASDDFSNMGEWSDTLTTPCSLSGYLNDNHQYFQYKVILNTTDSLSTPVLHDVGVTWNHVGIEGEPGIESFVLYGAIPNPAHARTMLFFSIPEDSQIDLTVYELTGRLVISTNREYTAGVHEITLNDLINGVYLIRMTAGKFTETQRFVVIE